MESLSHAALLISFLAFADVAFGQESQQLSYLLSGRRGFGDESGLEVGPRRYVIDGGNVLSAASDASFPYGTARLAIGPGGFERDYAGRAYGVENFGNSDIVPYGRLKLSGRKTIVILIRRRRPRSQGGSGFEDGGGRWGRPDYDYPLDNQSTSQKRRARRALLRILLSKLLLAASGRSLARDGSDEDEGRDSRSEQPWSRNERSWTSAWRVGEGSDFSSGESYDGRGSRWTREGFGGEGSRVLLRIVRPNTGESSGSYVIGSGQSPHSGVRLFPSESIGGISGNIPATSSDESAPLSDTASSDAGYGILRNMGSISPGSQRHLFPALSSFLRGRLIGSRGIEGSSESVEAQPSTWPVPHSIEQPPNQAAYGNGDSSYVGMGSNYYPLFRPRVMIRLPQLFTQGGQTGIPGASYDGSFGGLPDTAVNPSFDNRYIPGSVGISEGNPIATSESNGPHSVSNTAYENSPSVNGPQKS